MYLTAVCLSRGTRDLQSSLQHAVFLVVAYKLLVATCGILFPDQKSNQGPLHWEPRVLATGPTGKSSDPFHIDWSSYFCLCSIIVPLGWEITEGSFNALANLSVHTVH